jgi:hypothetical protein
MTVFVIITTVLFLWMLMGILGTLRRMQMSLGLIAACYLAWLDGQEEYGDVAKRLIQHLAKGGTGFGGISTTMSEGENDPH